MGLICGKCGKEVDRICSNCWNCDKCCDCAFKGRRYIYAHGKKPDKK